MVEDVAALLVSQEQTAYCMTNVDNAEESRRNCAGAAGSSFLPSR